MLLLCLTGRADDDNGDENSERTSGHLGGLFFFGVQRSDYNFNFEVSGGPFRFFNFEVSGGPIRTSTLMWS